MVPQESLLLTQGEQVVGLLAYGQGQPYTPQALLEGRAAPH